MDFAESTGKGKLSIVKMDVCKPFVYPTPFELHFSNAYLQWYKTNPLDYVEKMNGVDKDLAAHFTIIYQANGVERRLCARICFIYDRKDKSVNDPGPRNYANKNKHRNPLRNQGVAVFYGGK